MPNIKTCLVGALGLLEHEMRLVQSILKHGNEQHAGRYGWTEEAKHAHVMLVNADSDDAMKGWYGLSRGQLAPIWIFVTSKHAVPEVEYCLVRPLAPVKVLGVLEKMFNAQLLSVLGEQIFVNGTPPGAAGSVPVAREARRALVVDDSPTVRKQLEQELSRAGLQVASAETGEQCLEMLERGAYDIVFLDVVLPGMDGYEVCKRIRRNQMTKQVPVIMLTSKTSSFDRMRGSMAGCSTYLTKPVEYGKFSEVLQEYMPVE